MTVLVRATKRGLKCTSIDLLSMPRLYRSICTDQGLLMRIRAKNSATCGRQLEPDVDESDLEISTLITHSALRLISLGARYKNNNRSSKAKRAAKVSPNSAKSTAKLSTLTDCNAAS